jgi:predicted nucleic acid-binding protein
VARSAEATLLEFIRDPEDRFIVATALMGRADILVTGDRDLLDVREQITGVQILMPRECWMSLRLSR